MCYFEIMSKHKVIIAGAGQIGSTISHFLAQSNFYEIVVADVSHEHIDPCTKTLSNVKLVKLDITDRDLAQRYLRENQFDAIVNCLPHFLNKAVMDLAHELGLYYFDLSEDVESREYAKSLAQNSAKAFVSHCGLAPGFINIVAQDLIGNFEKADEVKMRCGALPQSSSNVLQYARTWSTDGLINEYINPCYQLVDGKKVQSAGLSDLEQIQIDGANYEAFNTSGGIGTLLETHLGKVETLNYKTIRYPGHCEKMQLLCYGLKLDHDRPTLKKIIEQAIPRTSEDVVIVYVAVVGRVNGTLERKTFVHKYYPERIFGLECSAIRAATASSACAVVDTVLSNPKAHKGFVRQEDFRIEQILDNQFAGYLNF